MGLVTKPLVTAQSDADDQLISAEEPLAGLQLRCGGSLPGTIAIPALLEVVRKARRYNLKLARSIQAQDCSDAITAWIEVSPREDGEPGCDIAVRNWQSEALIAEVPAAIEHHKQVIDRSLSELTAQLDPAQNVLAVEADAADLQHLAGEMSSAIGTPWTDFVIVEGGGHRQPMHWRLLDGAKVAVSGSDRHWTAHLYPRIVPGGSPAGFELCLTSEELLPEEAPVTEDALLDTSPGMLGRDIAPVLRLPIARIIANAETIRTRMAGPLADEYAEYASDIASAGQHLLALLDDLSTLEVVEADEFTTAPDRIDLADVARRAAGILGVRARERGIAIDAPKPGETLPAVAEFRRVLQILLNLVGNAIRYSPEGSQVWIRLEEEGDRVRLIVADQGPGIGPDEQARVFEKFERLGRSGDGGSGLGLYISRRLARAMQGELSVESAAGQGARFVLELPADIADSAPPSQADQA